MRAVSCCRVAAGWRRCRTLLMDARRPGPGRAGAFRRAGAAVRQFVDGRLRRAVRRCQRRPARLRVRGRSWPATTPGRSVWRRRGRPHYDRSRAPGGGRRRLHGRAHPHRRRLRGDRGGRGRGTNVRLPGATLPPVTRCLRQARSSARSTSACWPASAWTRFWLPAAPGGRCLHRRRAGGGPGPLARARSATATGPRSWPRLQADGFVGVGPRPCP